MNPTPFYRNININKTFNYLTVCIKNIIFCRSSVEYERHIVATYLQNTCNNKTTCDFKATDSSFNVSCEQTCTGLAYDYKCIGKSFVLRSLLSMFSSI
jgi:hypothetical protein